MTLFAKQKQINKNKITITKDIIKIYETEFVNIVQIKVIALAENNAPIEIARNE